MPKLYAGVDLGGTSMIAVVANRRGKVLGQSECATDRTLGPLRLIETIGEQVKKAAADAGVKLSKIERLGIGAPGAIDHATGTVTRAPNLGWVDVPLGPELEKQTGLDVAIGNDVQVAIIGEHAFGAAQGVDRAVGIWIGTGVGGGLIVGGKLDRGFRGAAGEIGHMVLDENGPLCGCGRRGCVEAYASRTAMERDVRALSQSEENESAALRIMREKNKPRMTSSVIEDALDERDPIMIKVITDAQHRLGNLAGSIVNLFDPQMVVIGGGVAQRLGERFIEPIRNIARARFLRPDPEGLVHIEHAALGDYSGALGACALAAE